MTLWRKSNKQKQIECRKLYFYSTYKNDEHINETSILNLIFKKMDMYNNKYENEMKITRKFEVFVVLTKKIIKVTQSTISP